MTLLDAVNGALWAWLASQADRLVLAVAEVVILLAIFLVGVTALVHFVTTQLDRLERLAK